MHVNLSSKKIQKWGLLSAEAKQKHRVVLHRRFLFWRLGHGPTERGRKGRFRFLVYPRQILLLRKFQKRHKERERHHQINKSLKSNR